MRADIRQSQHLFMVAVERLLSTRSESWPVWKADVQRLGSAAALERRPL